MLNFFYTNFCDSKDLSKWNFLHVGIIQYTIFAVLLKN